MKERTTPTRTIWAVVLLGLLGVVPEVSADLDLGVCQSSCSAVPQDLWPYCCETHHTCCEQFADSCIHDCLPRVNSGDVSAVEERPGLCCALYNLCCFRETPRISSIRNHGVVEPQSFPVTHRFSTLPGGPGRNRQSSVSIPKTPLTAAPSPAPVPSSFSKSKTNNVNRRPVSTSRPKSNRNQVNSFRDTSRPDTHEEIFNNRATDDNLEHRFERPDPTTERSTPFKDSQKEEESNTFNRPKTPNVTSKLTKLTRPVNPTPASERPDFQEPAQSRANTITPKALVRPTTGSVFRPANPRPLTNPEPETAEVIDERIEQEQIKPNRQTLLNRSLQQRKPVSLNASTQPPTVEEPVHPQKKEEKNEKLPRRGPLIRPGINRENSRPLSEPSEQLEQVTISEVQNSREPKLLRPKIKPFLPGKKDSGDSENPPQTDQAQDQLVSDSIVNQQTLTDETSTFLKANSAPELSSKPTEPNRIGNGSPIRRIKLIRPRENNKTPRPRNQEQLVTEAEHKQPQQITTGTTVISPTTRPQVTRGSNRNTQSITTPLPQVTQGRTITNTEESRGRLRGRTHFAQESSIQNTPGTARGSSRSQSSRSQSSRSQTTQVGSRGSVSSKRGRTRSRSRTTVTEPAAIAQSQDKKETNALVHEQAKLLSPEIKEEMMKKVIKSSGDASFTDEEKIMEVDKEMKKVKEEAVQTPLTNEDNIDNILPTGAPIVEEATPVIENEETTVAKNIHTPIELPSEDQKTIQPETSKQTEDETESKTVADQLSALGQSPKLVPSPRQSSKVQASKSVTETDSPRVTSQLLKPRVQEPVQQQEQRQSTRQNSESQRVSRQRTTAQPASRQRTSSTTGQTTTRSRGRLTARDRLALGNTEN